jgi:precorrin-6B methylase 1
MQGFRARFARPVAFVLIGHPPASEYGQLVSLIAHAHNAEVLDFMSVSNLTEYCSQAGMGMSEETVRSLLNEGAQPICS